MIRYSDPSEFPESMMMRPRTLTWTGAVVLASLALLFSSCKPRPAPPRTRAQNQPQDFRDAVSHERLGRILEQPPWIAHVNTADLDQDGLLDILACESRDNEILWLRQTSLGVFEEKVIARDLLAPVHVEAADMDADGDLDLLISVMGFVFPNNDMIGSVVILENDGAESFTPHFILENTYRVTDMRAGDFNGDGRIDLAVGQFGYDQGQVMWMERTGDWEFENHVLINLSGAINVCVDDFNGDAKPDIAALISQQWEEVYVLTNQGDGAFETKRIWGSTNEDYGSSGISLADMNKDGRMDIVYSNGDGFGPAAVPGPRPWHGVQWFENTGNGFFRYHRVGDLPGAYSPIGVDFDGDGAMDILATSAYADWERKGTGFVSLMWFHNDGAMNFTPRVLAYRPRDLISLAAGKFDGTDEVSLVTGGFPVYPPYEGTERITLWRRKNP